MKNNDIGSINKTLHKASFITVCFATVVFIHISEKFIYCNYVMILTLYALPMREREREIFSMISGSGLRDLGKSHVIVKPLIYM